MPSSVQTGPRGCSVLVVHRVHGDMSSRVISTFCHQDPRRCAILTSEPSASIGCEVYARRVTSATICTNTTCEGSPNADSMPRLASATAATIASTSTWIRPSRGGNAKSTIEAFVPKVRSVPRSTFDAWHVPCTSQAFAHRGSTVHADTSRVHLRRAHHGRIRPSALIDP